jgi:hypothetical protein
MKDAEDLKGKLQRSNELELHQNNKRKAVLHHVYAIVDHYI